MAVNCGTNRWATSNYLVAPTLAEGAGYTTIAAAIAAAPANSTIFIKPGTYTENLTLSDSVDLVAFTGDADTPNVTIVGKLTATFAGTCSISGIRLQTNGDFALVVSGAAATKVNIKNCFLNAADNTFLSYTSSSSSSSITFTSCVGNIATIGDTFFISSGAGSISINYSIIDNTGLSTTASTISDGIVSVRESLIVFPITSSGTTAIITGHHSEFNTNDLNTTAITHNSTGVNSAIIFCRIATGSATAVSIGASANLQLTRNSIATNNATPITVTGTSTQRENYFFSAANAAWGLGIGTDATIEGQLIRTQYDYNGDTSIRLFNRNNTAAQTDTGTRFSLSCKLNSDSSNTEAGLILGNDLTDRPGGEGTTSQNRLVVFSSASVDGITYFTQRNGATHNFRTYDGIPSGKSVGNVTTAGEWTYPLQPGFLAEAAAQSLAHAETLILNLYGQAGR